MMRYRKKPVVVEAIQFQGDGKNTEKVLDFIGEGVAVLSPCGCSLRIDTLEGRMIALPGHWIIRGVAGEIYPCKPEIFAATYEPAEDSDG